MVILYQLDMSQAIPVDLRRVCGVNVAVEIGPDNS
jgi:hypothetical protein